MRMSRKLHAALLIGALTHLPACAKAERPVPPPSAVAAADRPAQETQGSGVEAKTGVVRAVAETVQVTLRGKAPAAIVSKLTVEAESLGGYLVSSDTKTESSGEISARLSVRVPAKSLPSYLRKLRGMGELVSETRQGEDVTAEVIDVEARLVSKRTLEKRLLELLGSARNIEDSLKVEAELARVRTEIEQLSGQSRNLEQRTTYALVELTVESPEAHSPTRVKSFWVRLKEAIYSAFSTSQSFVIGLIEMLGVLIPLSTCGFLAYLPFRYLHRRAKRLRQARLMADFPVAERTPPSGPDDVAEDRKPS